jgi:hypothetical protein
VLAVGQPLQVVARIGAAAEQRHPVVDLVTPAGTGGSSRRWAGMGCTPSGDDFAAPGNAAILVAVDRAARRRRKVRRGEQQGEKEGVHS